MRDSPLAVLGALALLGPVALLGWLAAGSSGAPQAEPKEDVFQPPPAVKPAVPVEVRSHLMVAKLKGPDARPAEASGDALRDAPHGDGDGTLTGTLAEIEERLMRERRPVRLADAAQPRRPAPRGTCLKECRAERGACAGGGKPRYRRTWKACQAAYKECAEDCSAAGR